MRKIVHTEKDALKRRDFWPRTWMYYQANNSSLEDIQKKTFGRIESEKDLKNYLGKRLNPIFGFRQGNFFFDEEGLRNALQAIKADLSQFRMEVKECEKTEVTDRYPFSSVEYGRRGHDILLFYARRKDVQPQTCILAYRNINMEIRRWSIKGSRYGTYEVTPIQQIPSTKWVMTEAEFDWLDIPNLLKDLAFEYDLCQEEFTYYAKQMRLNSMEVSVMDEEQISFAAIDETAMERIIKESESKGLDKEQTFQVLVEPWMKAIHDYLVQMTGKYKDSVYMCNLRIEPEENRRLARLYDHDAKVKDKVTFGIPPLIPFKMLCEEKQVEVNYMFSETHQLSAPVRRQTVACFGVEGSEIIIEETLYHYDRIKDRLIIFPNDKDRRFQLQISGSIGLHALVGYLKQMPALCQQMDKFAETLNY